jgi:hypothetical protein
MNLQDIKKMDDLGLLNDKNTMITTINLLAHNDENWSWNYNIDAITLKFFVELLINHLDDCDWKYQSELNSNIYEVIENMWWWGNDCQKIKELVWVKAEDQAQYSDFNDWYSNLETHDHIWNAKGEDWENWLNYLQQTPYEELDTEVFEEFIENNFNWNENGRTGTRFELCYDDE